MAQRMKSDQVRVQWRDVLDNVQAGEAVLVERYNRPVAQVLPVDDTIVVLRVPNANQAERLRRLVAEHGSLGIPFPNNTTHGWRVVDGNGEPVNPHAIPSVAVEAVDLEEPAAASTVIASIIPGRSIHGYDLLDELTDKYGLPREQAHAEIHAALDQCIDIDGRDKVILAEEPIRPELLERNPHDLDIYYWMTISGDTAETIRDQFAAVYDEQ